MTTNFRDGLSNVISGIGTMNDKATHSHYGNAYYSLMDLEAAYENSTWFRKIVEIPVDDSIREGIKWQAKKTEIEALETGLKDLDFWRKYRQARIWARRDGGAALVLGLPGDPSKPVDIANVKKGDLTVVTALNRDEITPIDQINVILDKDYGKPGMYQLANGQNIHPSRVIRFIGNERSRRMGWDGWGVSIYPPMRKAIIDCDTTTSAIANLLHEAKIDVLSIPNLTEQLMTERYEQALMKRVMTANLFKGLTNTLIVDAGSGTPDSPAEKWEQKQINFAGLPEILASQLMVLSGVADIPATRLLGKAPDGMNATGDGDLRNYYDDIRAQQTNELQPLLDPFFNIFIASTIGSRPKKIYFTWKPLYSLNEKETAEVEKIYADVLTALVNSGVVKTEILEKITTNRMIESGQYPGIDEAVEEFKNAVAPALEEPTEEDIAILNSGVSGASRQSGRTAPIGRDNIPLGDAAPRALYINRKVVNSADIIAWANSQGIPDMLPGLEMHVTVLYSRDAVDWMKTGESWQSELKIAAGGPRIVEKFGSNAIVLSFASNEISWRHRSLVDMGASHDWPDYQPHITVGFTNDPKFDVDAIEPYQGEIILGPEIYGTL